MSEEKDKMVWSWEVLERIYNVCKVNVASMDLPELLAATPACLRAMVNEVRGFNGKAPVDATKPVDGAEVDEVVSDFFGLAIPKSGESPKPSTGEISPTTT